MRLPAPLNSASSASKPAHVLHDLLEPHQVPVSEHGVPVLRDENRVRVKGEDTVPVSADITVSRHKAD
jgi:hypothetical protein